MDKFRTPENVEMADMTVQFLINEYSGEFSKDGIEVAIEEYIKKNEWPMGKVMNCLRLSLTGSSNGLGIADIISLIGSREFAIRIAFANERLG